MTTTIPTITAVTKAVAATILMRELGIRRTQPVMARQYARKTGSCITSPETSWSSADSPLFRVLAQRSPTVASWLLGESAELCAGPHFTGQQEGAGLLRFSDHP